MDVKQSFMERTNKFKLRYFDEILEVKSEEAVMASVTYASFLNHVGINPDNYVLYFRCLEVPDRWVIDALTRERDLEHYLDVVEPTHGIIHEVFRLFNANKKGGLYDKVLVILLGFLNRVYLSPQEGYDLFAPTIEDLNDLAKFLDETKKQDYPSNRIILDILKHLNELDFSEKTGPRYEMGMHAGKIRSNFLDNTRSLKKILPSVLLEKDKDFGDGIRPAYTYEN